MEDSAGRGHGPLTDLYRMLGIGQHTSVEELRDRYERAVAAATRSGDMKRAQQLVSAFEALSGPRRDSVFGRRFATGYSQPIPPRSTMAGSPAARRRVRTAPRRKFGMALWARLLVYLLIAPIVVVGAVTSWLHPERFADHANIPPLPIIRTGPAPIPATTAPIATSVSPNSRLIPLNAPVDDQGFVLVRCDSQPMNILHPPEIMFARRGDIVTCHNGAIPAIIN